MRRWKTAAVVMLAVTVMTACSGQRPVETSQAEAPPAATGPTRGGRLVYGLSADGNGFNPITDQFAVQSYSMTTPIIEPLVSVDANGDWRPYLAESLTPNDAYDEWAIKVRPNISFSDGTPLTGEVVKANLEAQKASPLTAAVLAPVTAVELTDPMTVTVKLRQPWVAFPYQLSLQVGMIIPPASLADLKEASRTPVGTGPFLFKEYVPDNRMVVTRNPKYWREGLPYLDEVEFRILPDSQTRAQTLEAGGVDAVGTNRDEDVVKFGDMKDAYTVHRAQGMSVSEYVFLLNTAAPPLDDVRVRRALAHALDRDTIIKTLRGGLTEPADGPWSKDSKWYVDGGYPDYDLAKATALVQEVEADKGPIRFEAISTTDPNTMQLVELCQDMWRKAGIDVTIRQADQADLINRALTGDYGATVWTAFSAADPDGEYNALHQAFARPIGQISLNPTRLKDKQLSDALDAGRVTPDEAVRKQAYATVQQRLRDQMPILFIDHLNTGAVIAKTKVRGIGEHTLPDGEKGRPLTGAPIPYHPFAQIWVSE
ncbi:4-phytase / acid phosphatase/peptide/nickel transport system substrate-binding protein [Nonomuraea maritima]|uniref:4-phytase / acid phosphatase/peptide/nickel transport system substrate-binding protein n=1 Tax=Nonomuraea maritima TaxID=683260 RepID=A0A1G8Z414_9ACTN|nr:ABC transporter substrate-binding protein [Nonomuraea maritima]SDK09869.1 4-phytase / acid phosphatase/peptide/nickel transport system substrate-binding protein [Nonomuraea maritima]